MTARAAWRIVALAIVGALVASASGQAQSRSEHRARAHGSAPKQTATREGVPNAMQGFSKNRDKPIQIEAGSLEVRDKDKVATFRGKVHVVQGDTDMRCNVLTVFYEDTPSGGSNGAAAGATGLETQKIKRLEARGNVVVTQKDQVATGDVGDFDMRKNLITLKGNVAVSQGKNVLRGDRLLVDMTSGVSHIESNTGRVQGLFQPASRESSPAGGKGRTSNDSGALPHLH